MIFIDIIERGRNNTENNGRGSRDNMKLLQETQVLTLLSRKLWQRQSCNIEVTARDTSDIIVSIEEEIIGRGSPDNIEITARVVVLTLLIMKLLAEAVLIILKLLQEW